MIVLGVVDVAGGVVVVEVPVRGRHMQDHLARMQLRRRRHIYTVSRLRADTPPPLLPTQRSQPNRSTLQPSPLPANERPSLHLSKSPEYA